MEPDVSDVLPPSAEPMFCGVRWAAGLAAVLLLSLAVLTVVRWFEPPAAAEQIVQVPVAAATPTPMPRPEVLAPDPGDTP